MKKTNERLKNILFILIIFISFAITTHANAASLRILCSTFPIYQITRNIAQGREGATVSLMLPAQLGCPHDYALTPKDMQLLANADVLVINGLGMEEFLGAPILHANPRIKVIDSSFGITGILPLDESTGHGEGQDNHSGNNPHLFASPRQTARIAEVIAQGLSKFDPQYSKTYRTNSQAYGEKMKALAQDFISLRAKLVSTKIITQHGVFDYLARDMGLDVVAVVELHAGKEPSAAEMLALVKTAKASQAKAIFAEPQYSDKIIRAIAKEAGITAATLDPVASGPNSAGLDYYEKVMRNNMAILASTLGTR